MTLVGTLVGLQRFDELLDAMAIQDIGERIERRQLLILFFFRLQLRIAVHQIMDLPALLAMLAAQPQPLRQAISGGEDHPRAQDAQVPVFRTDPVTHEFDLVDLNIVVGSGEIAKQVDGKCRGIAEIGLAKSFSAGHIGPPTTPER